MEIKINIKDCSECPHFKSTPYPTDDSFERAEHWWCMLDDDTVINHEKLRKQIKTNMFLLKLRHIAGYVEWNDKINIPEWCPIKT